MKSLFSSLLILLMFRIILTNNIPMNKVSYEIKSTKHLRDDKEKIRMLQGLESKAYFQSKKPDASLQVKKIYNFIRTSNQVKFKIFFYFFAKKIIQNIYMRIKIIYKNTIRNLQDNIEEERVLAICIIREEYEDKLGNEGKGENIDYDCSASTTLNSEITNITINIDYPLELGGEQIIFDKINFDEDAVKEAENIINSPIFNKSGSLDDAKIEIPIKKDYFIIKGKLNPEDLLSKGDIIPIKFVGYDTKGEKTFQKISCTAMKINGTNCTLKCDTTNQPIKTTIKNINHAKSIRSKIYLTFNINQEDIAIETPYPKIINDKPYSNEFFVGVFISIILICIIILIATTIEQYKFEILICGIMVALLLATLIKDWYDFITIGAKERRLTAARYLVYFTKFSMSFLATVLAFMIAKRAIHKRDAILLRLCFIFSMGADFSFSIIRAFFPDSILNTILGITFFVVYQVGMIYRHTRETEIDRHFPKIYFVPAFFLLAFIILLAVGVIDYAIGLVAVYASIVICSLIMSIKAPCKNLYPQRNVKFIRWGMILFTIGDVMVGAAMVSGEDNSPIQYISTIADNLVWLFYLPGQILIIWSAAEKIFDLK